MNSNCNIIKASTLFILATLAVVLTFFSEKSPLLGGYGSDGLYYGHYAVTLNKGIASKEFPRRGFERILGMAIPHAILSILPSSPEPDKQLAIDGQTYIISKRAIMVYMVYNLILYFLSLFLWHLIATKANLNIWAYVLSFVLLFVNFSNLKQYFYEPVMLDPTTLCYSLLLLYVWLYGGVRSLLLISVLGLLVNTASAIVCLLLLGFKPTNIYSKDDVKPFALPLALFAASVVIGFSVYYFYRPLCNMLMENETIGQFFFISVFITASAVFAIAYQVLKHYAVVDVKTIWQNTRVIYALLFVAITFAYRFVSALLSLPQDFTICDDKPHSLYNFFILILRLANSRPAGFLSSHFAYFGITLPFIILNYKHIVRQVLQYGYGATLLLGVMLVLFINTESHQFVIVLPFVVYYIVTNPLYNNLKAWHIGVLTGMALLASKVWFTINPLDPTKYATGNMQDFYALYEFPMQRYFMNLGPWMGNQMYVVHLVLCIAAMVIIYLMQRQLHKGQTSVN